MIKLGKSETVSHTFYLDDVLSDAGTVTVTVKNYADEVVHTGSTSKASNVYSFTMPAQDELGALAIEWNGTILDDITYEEVIGDYLFELSELRTLLTSRTLTANAAKPAALLRDVRDQVTDTFETAANVSSVQRRRTDRVSVSGGVATLRRAAVRQVVTVDGEAFTGDYYTHGLLTGLSGTTATVVYDHGLDDGVTAEARSMALDLAVYALGSQARTTPSNAESMTDPTSGATYRLAVVGTRGIQVAVPHVDAYLKRIRFDMPGVA